MEEKTMLCTNCGDPIQPTQTNTPFIEEMPDSYFGLTFPVLEKVANAGDYHAMHALAEEYFEKTTFSYYKIADNPDIDPEADDNPNYNPEAAKYWYRKALVLHEQVAEAGNILEQLKLANKYAYDRCGAPPNPEKAEYWFNIAYKNLENMADNENAIAQNRLGDLLRFGFEIYDKDGGKRIILERDKAAAKKLYKKSTLLGNLKALSSLQYGFGSEAEQNYWRNRDLEIKFIHHRNAAAHGGAREWYELGKLYYLRYWEREYDTAWPYNMFWCNELRIMNNSKMLADPDAQSGTYWFRKAFESAKPLAESGDANAQMVLGDIYAIGAGMPEIDYKTALHWYEKAGDNGNVDAMCNVVCAYEDSREGVEKNEALAEEWLKKAVDAGSQRAQEYLDYGECACLGNTALGDYTCAVPEEEMERKLYEKYQNSEDRSTFSELYNSLIDKYGEKEGHAKFIDKFRECFGKQ